MPDEGLRVEIKGMERLQEKIKDPQLVLAPLGDLLQEAGRIGQKAAVFGIDGGTGIAVRSINYEVRPLEMRLFSAMRRARALSIEEGRPPNDPTMTLRGIIKWREAVGHPEPGIVIFRDLQQRGVRGRFFMQAAKNTIQEHLPQWLREMGEKVRQKWEE